MNQKCQDHFVWKLFNKVQEDLFVSFYLLKFIYYKLKIKFILYDGFLGDGRWRQVIRRCASVAETGVTGVCNWGVYENGVYWEECYCSEDSCNIASNFYTSISTILVLFLVSIFLR